MCRHPPEGLSPPPVFSIKTEPPASDPSLSPTPEQEKQKIDTSAKELLCRLFGVTSLLHSPCSGPEHLGLVRLLLARQALLPVWRQLLALMHGIPTLLDPPPA